jgi:Tol biopolymer transport system component
MESDGTGIQRLTTDPAFEREPVWDPEGGWIAFASDRQPARAVWIMRADGALAMPLSFTAQRGGQPRWTP